MISRLTVFTEDFIFRFQFSKQAPGLGIDDGKKWRAPSDSYFHMLQWRLKREAMYRAILEKKRGLEKSAAEREGVRFSKVELVGVVDGVLDFFV